MGISGVFMPNKKPKAKKEADDESTGAVRVSKELHRRIILIAKWRGMDVAELLNPILGPAIEAEWKVLQQEMRE